MTWWGTWVAGNPGAAGWILSEAFSGYRQWRAEDDDELDAETSGVRLLLALRTWSDALGPLAEGVLPLPVVQGPVGLGVTVSGHHIDIAFSTGRPAADYVTGVPPGVHPLSRSRVAGWRPWMSGGVPESDAWPWIMVRNMIAKTTLKRLSDDPFLGASDGIWVQERRFDLSRRLLGRGTLFYGDLPAGEVRRRAAEVLDFLRKDSGASASFGGSAVYSGAELEQLISSIDAMALMQLESHLPDRDVPHPASNWVWDAYSPQRLMEFEVEVYGRACEAYDEALEHSFGRLGWAMPSSWLAPFGVLLELRCDDAEERAMGPGLTAMRVPMALMPRFVPLGLGASWSASGRAAITRTNREREADWEHHSGIREAVLAWLAEQNRESIGSIGWTSTLVDDMSKVRPASSVAAQWLSNDLKELGLGDGTFPQLL